MAEKGSFLIYKSWGTLMENLDNETAGILVKAIFAYQRGEEVKIDNPVLLAVFQVMTNEFDENDAKYQERCEKNRQIAIERERKRREQSDTSVNEEARNSTNVHERTRTYTNSTELEPELDCDSELELESESDSDSIAKTKKKSKAVKKKKPSKKEIEVVKTYVDDPMLNARVLEFIEYRKQIRDPMGDIAITKMLAKLEKIGKSDHERMKILDESMANGWKGIYPLKEEDKKVVNWEAL